MSPATHRRLLLGVSGGIAAYKSPDLVRRLRERGFAVRVVMSAAAAEFVTAQALQAVSGQPVRQALFDPGAEAAMSHIELARWAELVLVAPATAHLMARLAHGLADDLLTTLCLASEAPIALAPAMNRVMWDAPATQANAALLRERGVHLWGPAEGEQACGERGPGRMLEPADLAARAAALLGGDGPLAGTTVLVTAGPTREAIDPVRFISNHSSGKMGHALARAAAEAGARVTLVSGPCALEAPPGVERVAVESAAEMYQAVMARAPGCDIFIAAAAVADYRPAAPREVKIKKGPGALRLELERTADILAAVAALDPAPFTVGFAAETEDLEGNARAKLEAKGIDLIAANRVGGEASAFGAEDNALAVYWRGGERALGRAPKIELARALIGLVAEQRRARRPA